MKLAPGTRLGPYEVLAPLGAGGMGEVYRARDSRLDRDVALKVVAARHGEDADAIRRFAREARIAARLTHPNVCTLFDAGSEGEVAYFVMELLEGETLAARIARGPVPEEDVRRIGADVARGLARAHELGFVHRDLKPQNLFLTATGAKVLDFGLARSGPAEAAGDEETASLLTEAGRVLGTVGYMAPEQVRGDPPSAAADLWALGCVLFECLTGRRTFAGRSAQETFAATLTSPPDWGALPPGVSPSTRTLLERLLDKDPATRLVDASAVAQALSSGIVSTTPASASPKARRLRIAVGLTVLVALLGAGAALWVRREARTPIDSLAVLPFAASGSDADLAELCTSLSDDVLARVSQVPNLKVMAASAVARYAGAAVDPLAAARELGVRAVLTGHAVGRAGRVTVSTELVDARDGRRLWGERFEGPLASISSMPSDVAAALAAHLRLGLSGDDRARLARRDTENREAYELWVRGRRAWASGRRQADLDKALAYFEKALETDPAYARAWTGIAEVWDFYGYSHRRPVPEAFEKAKAAARRALELDPAIADAHAVLAHATMMTGDVRSAEEGFRRALALDANSLDALHWYSHLLMKQSRWDESLALSKKLLELDPLGWWNVHLGEHYRAKGDHDLALQSFRRAVDLDAENLAARWQYGRTLLEAGRTAEATTQLEAALRLDPDSVEARSVLADAYERAGRAPEAAALRTTPSP